MINTNARSLKPKMSCFLDNFKDLELTFAVISETWFSNNKEQEIAVKNLLLGHGLTVFAKNRPPGPAGFSHGGIALVIKDNVSKFKQLDYPNPGDFEVLVAGGTVQKLRRKMYVVACYIPPNYRVPRAKECMRHISDVVLSIKNQDKEAYVCVTCDFNQWEVESYLEDFPHVEEIETGPTRNGRRIDRVFCNWKEDVDAHRVLHPLEADLPGDDGRIPKSDHSIQLVEASLARKDPIKWEKFTYRPYNDKAADKFAESMKNQGWETVLTASGSNAKARALQLILDDLMDHHFPTKTSKRKEADLPWLNDVARKKIVRKRAIFKSESRSTKWRAARHDLEKYLEVRREAFLKAQREKLFSPDACKKFFSNVKSFKSYEKPKSFDVRDIEPNKSDKEVADGIANYFNRISREFSPLDPFQIPTTYHRQLPRLSVEVVTKRLMECKKPNSMVQGDIFPKLINKCAIYLAVPLADIYNEILTTYVWPINWKIEYVTAIPKKKMPESYADLRNTSCTKFVSKVFESFVLQFAMEEVELKNNQFGGVKGCSTAHMLIDITQEICHNAEDYRSATAISALDFAKAFNRLSYQHCLKAFKKKGASTPIIRLVATFLTNRTMKVKVGNAWSEQLDITGGCPQGSILGVFLFNMTTEDLEDDFLDFELARLTGTGLGGLEEEGEGPDHGLGKPNTLQTARTYAEVTPATSTPTRRTEPPSLELSPLGGGVYRHQEVSLTFTAEARNHPTLEAPPTETKVGTQVLREKAVKIRKYVDDCISIEKVNFGRTEIQIEQGQPIKKKRAHGIQNSYISVSANAKDKGMLVNGDKTGLLCVSDSLHYKPVVFFEDGDLAIESGDSLKILGYHLSDRPGAHNQVASVTKTIRQRYWTLRHLAGVGFNKLELVKVYCSSILPLADYCDVVYHSQLTDEQDQLLENAQVGALRTIFGPKISARDLRSMAGVTTLRERRIQHCDNFARKCVQSQRFSTWFPKKSGRRSNRSHEEIYVEEYARCDRLKNSPLFYMRRRLNNKEGKKYGERNRDYRED